MSARASSTTWGPPVVAPAPKSSEGERSSPKELSRRPFLSNMIGASVTEKIKRVPSEPALKRYRLSGESIILVTSPAWAVI